MTMKSIIIGPQNKHKTHKVQHMLALQTFAYRLHQNGTAPDRVNRQRMDDFHSIIAAENTEVSVTGDLACSFSCLRKILPAAERGISDRN